MKITTALSRLYIESLKENNGIGVCCRNFLKGGNLWEIFKKTLTPIIHMDLNHSVLFILYFKLPNVESV